MQLLTCTATTGTFTLFYNGKPSKAIPYNANAVTVTQALLSIPAITRVNIRRILIRQEWRRHRYGQLQTQCFWLSSITFVGRNLRSNGPDSRFGGDPSKVTIGGQSAGAASVSAHLLMKPSVRAIQVELCTLSNSNSMLTIQI